MDFDFDYIKSTNCDGVGLYRTEILFMSSDKMPDIEKQVDLTMCVIEGILKSRGMDFSDTIRAIAYCQRPEFYAAFKNWCCKRNLGLPHCPSYSTVCRDDLLFEVELDAAKNGEKQ